MPVGDGGDDVQLSSEIRGPGGARDFQWTARMDTAGSVDVKRGLGLFFRSTSAVHSEHC